MASRIYTKFREVIDDTTAGSYAVRDEEVWDYLDNALAKLSAVAGVWYAEDVDIDATDISNGYFTLTYDPIMFEEDSVFGTQDQDWYFKGYNQIGMVNPSEWTAQTFNDVKYKRYFKRFKGATKEDSALDHPQEAELGLVYYAVGSYLFDVATVSADGSTTVLSGKSEDGMSVSYAMPDSLSQFANPQGIQDAGIKIFQRLPNAQTKIFSVKL